MDEIETYIQTIEEPRRAAILRLHKLISEAAPQIDQRLWEYSGKLIGYGTYHYKGRSTEGEWFIIGLANRKAYISLYSMALRDSRYLVELYAEKMPGVKTGRSCINIRKPQQIDDSVITDLVKETYEFFKDEPSLVRR